MPANPNSPKPVIRVEKRGGKEVTVIRNLHTYGSARLEKIAGDIKKSCGCGGTVKNGAIEIQGNKNDAVKSYLIKNLLALILVLFMTSCKSPSVNINEPGTQPYDYGELALLNLDFNSQTYSPWEGQYTADGVNFSYDETGAYEGSHCGKFKIGADGDLWTSPNTGLQSARSELQLFNTAPSDTELYYSWYIRLDSSYTESDNWQVIGQFHDQPDPALGETWSTYPAHSPPLAYKYRNGNLIISVYSWDTNSVMDIASVPLSKGVWHRIKTRVFWSTESTGFVEVWLDGVPIESASAITRYTAKNCFNNAGNYIKIGLYRSNNITTEGIVYYDNIKSGLTSESVD
ncbi:MAG: heparin lyase I family protein [Candidatus Goldbacteria bacterium]|nr:heparin lyase I family protein [Candidatus Goldiibacteriota bacterium]